MAPLTVGSVEGDHERLICEEETAVAESIGTVGGVTSGVRVTLLTVTVTGLEVVVLPAASLAVAVRV